MERQVRIPSVDKGFIGAIGLCWMGVGKIFIMTLLTFQSNKNSF